MTTTLHVRNTGFAVLKTLKNYGIDTIFGIPGTHNLEFYRHLEELGMHPVTSRHEQGAGYASIGWSQQTGLPGVVITTSGPGLLNALSSVGTAYCESRPMIVLSPGVAEGEEFADNGALHETKDATGAAGAIALWSRRVRSASEAVDALHEAFEMFRVDRPRPVHIEIPLNVLESESDSASVDTAARAGSALAAAPDAEIARAAQMLAAAKKPVILAGGGSVTASEQLRELAERLGAPVVTTINGKAALAESHPLSLGAEIRLPAAQELVNTADTVLLIGSKLGEAELWGGVVEPSGMVVRIDRLESQANKNVRSDIALTGDSSVVLRQLLDSDELVAEEAAAGADAFGWLGEAGISELREQLRREAEEISPVLIAVAEQIVAGIPADAIVAGDSSQITYLAMTSAARQDRPNSFLYTPAYATLGFGLPAAIGAKVGSPERSVVCVIGDGALMFSVQELITAVEQKLDLTVVCVDNGGYGEIRQNELDRGIQPVGVDLVQPNWADLATAMGWRGKRIESLNDLTDEVSRAVNAGGLTLLHVPLAAL